MRTAIDLPDDLYRTLKARTGVTLGELVRRLIEQGLGRPAAETRSADHRDPPPVIVPPRGQPIPAVPRALLRDIEEEENDAKHARSARR